MTRNDDQGNGLPCMQEDEAVALTFRILGAPDARADLEKSGKGTAFLLRESHLVTCGHVIAAAYGRGLADGTWLRDAIPLGTTFRVQEANPYAAPIIATLRFYRPHAAADELADIAILELETEQAGAVPFSAAQPRHGTPLRAYGFPSGYKKTGGFVQFQTSGVDSLDWLQVDKQTLNGVPLRGGISGAPVWLGDLSAVIGMISIADEASGVAHIIPYDRIRRAAETLRCLPKIAGRSQEVFESLLKLNFTPQLSSVGRVLHEQIFAILLTGDDDHGHRVLIERIKRRMKVERASVLTVDLGKVSIRSDANRVHVNVGKWVDIDDNLALQQPQRVYEAIARRLKYKDTVMLFLPGPQTPKELIDEVVSNFWKPLTSTLKSRPGVNKRLLGIILDEFARRPDWGELEVATSFDQWRPELPLELPKLTAIDRTTLQDWVLDNTEDFSDALSASLTVEALFELSSCGIPERVFKHYCKMRALQWIEVKHQWLKS